MKDHSYDRYSLTKLPFISPPDKLYCNRNREEIKKRLNLFVQHRGFCVVTGEAGLGKSVTVREFCNSLNPKAVKSVYIPFSMFGEYDMLCSLCYQLELETSFMKSHMLERIRNRIRELQPVNIIAVFDEAQKMKHLPLEIIRTMTNFEFDGRNLVSVILSGTPEFLNILRLKISEHLEQRITMYANLKRLSREDTFDYVKHYMKDAGAGSDIFTQQALNAVFDITGGVPRIINSICSGALFEAADESSDLVNIDHIHKANQIITIPIRETQK